MKKFTALLEAVIATASQVIFAGALLLFWLFGRALRKSDSFIARQVLKLMLSVDHSVRRQVIAKLATPSFHVHPKNVFNFRVEFFRQNVNCEDVVLDIGSGSGVILTELSDVIAMGYGLDSDTRQMDENHTRYDLANIRFLVGDTENFEFKKFIADHSVSVVILSHILEHIADAPGFLAKLSVEVLLICVPSAENWEYCLRDDLGLQLLSDPDHEREYTRELLRSHLAVAGYHATYMGFNSEGEIVCRAERS